VVGSGGANYDNSIKIGVSTATSQIKCKGGASFAKILASCYLIGLFLAAIFY
jgi:hypothetical protein